MTGKKFRRLFFDIETSPNVVFSWNVGYDVRIDHDNILKERAIICICYKFEGDKKVHHLTWNKGDDKKILEKFAGIINTADEVIGHNSDKFDIKWVRTRCLYHGIPMTHDIKSIDTLKASRSKFRFNSNKLDYIGKYLGLGEKLDTGGFSLWKDIILKNSRQAMNKMVEYCKQDVILLESIFQKINSYIPVKTNAAVMFERDSIACPECLSEHTVVNRHKVSAAGIKSISMHCQSCGKYFSISQTKFDQASIKPADE